MQEKIPPPEAVAMASLIGNFVVMNVLADPGISSP